MPYELYLIHLVPEHTPRDLGTNVHAGIAEGHLETEYATRRPEVNNTKIANPTLPTSAVGDYVTNDTVGDEEDLRKSTPESYGPEAKTYP